MDFAPSQDGRILAAGIHPASAIPFFESFCFVNVFLQISKNRIGTVGFGPSQDGHNLGPRMAGAFLILFS